MKVLKFGGTSMGSVKSLQQVKSILLQENVGISVVVSAMSGVTNLLIEAGNLASEKNTKYRDIFEQIKQIHLTAAIELWPIEARSTALSELIVQINKVEEILQGVFLTEDLSDKVLARLSSFGECLSSFIFYHYLLFTENVKINWIDAQNLIKVAGAFLGATVNLEKTFTNLQLAIKVNEINIIPGFICSNEHNEVCTLGRGGSDYTAAITAGAIEAAVLEIWTDVSGMYTTNPKMVKQAFPIDHISYQEAMELSHFGAKVIYPPTIQPVLAKKIPILIKNTFEPNAKGTLISDKQNDQTIVSGISHIENISLLTLEGAGMVGIPGFSKRFFGALASLNINVVFITQASSEHSICVGILTQDEKNAEIAVNKEFAFEISLSRINPIIVENELAIIALVGESMKNHQGTSGRMFNVLGKNNVNIRAIAQGASERNISTVVHKKHIYKALNVLHEAFFESHKLALNLFIVGVGNVGEKLIEQLNMQTDYLKKTLNINLNVVALANSKQLLLNENGLNLNSWKNDLVKAPSYTLGGLIAKVKSLNLPNTVFVDNTASDQISNAYSTILKESIPIVSCNKIACSSQMDNYHRLKKLARDFNAPFLYETNVGAGLPIINTLQNLISSGDKILEIQAVLSGSLNFIFNNYSAQEKFVTIVKQAGEKGYTEPDPRIDLSGVDVMRKILILAREAGEELEMADIKVHSFLPKTAEYTESIGDFFDAIDSEEAFFSEMYNHCAKNNAQLKFVAKYNHLEGASVGLQEIDSSHPFYNLQGKDNIILFYTNRYKDQPLIIKGAGAGAEVTASGIFADIIKLANN